MILSLNYLINFFKHRKLSIILKNIERVKFVDYMRVLGLLLIILAHSQPNNIVFQIRTFDVPLMVYISAISFSKSNKDYLSFSHISSYFLKRIKRLVIPTWIFLIIFFSISKIVNNVFPKLFDYSFYKIFSTFSLESGIGYVWIIKVYLLIALVAPIIKWISKENKLLNFLFVTFLIISIVFMKNFSFNNTFLDFVKNNYFLIIFSYGLVYYFGMISNNLDIKKKIFINIFFSMIFFSLVILKCNFSIQADKYPPGLYYISYGIIMCILLNIIFDYLQKKIDFKSNRFIEFISKNSLDLYFIHIIPVEVLRQSGLFFQINNYVYRYLIIIIVTLILGYFFTLLKGFFGNFVNNLKGERI
ncbi:acyltransferase family protein [Streptococcus uberis]|uniref:acyltransferase family protein n=1 Tax=Streptococcus uberis TaxID=1349 RepID=UPI0006202A49|nr:hypothetical protein AF59_08000 [Streptococcus uberis C5072]